MDERGIPALPTAKRLGGAEKRCSEGVLPADLCGMCEDVLFVDEEALKTDPDALGGSSLADFRALYSSMKAEDRCV